MRTTTLGRAGPAIGMIGLGCMGMSFSYDMETPRDEATSIALIRQALDLGLTLLDTADAYGPYTNEELVGRALAGGRRDRAVLATKVGLLGDDGAATIPGRNPAGAGRDGSPEHVRRSIDASLRRLRTDRVDLYQLHRVDPKVPLEETWGAMAETVVAGKARLIGLSEVGLGEIRRAEAIHPVASVQSELSLWTRDALAEVVPYCQEHGLGFLAFAPLGRGFLAGRFSTADEVPSEDFRRGLPRFQPEAVGANQVIVDGLRRVAERLGATPAQIALAWAGAQGSYVVPIPGTKTPRYLLENAAAADLVLGADDLVELDALPAPVGARY